MGFIKQYILAVIILPIISAFYLPLNDNHSIFKKSRANLLSKSGGFKVKAWDNINNSNSDVQKQGETLSFEPSSNGKVDRTKEKVLVNVS